MAEAQKVILTLNAASTDCFNPDFKIASKKKVFYDAQVSWSCQSIRQCFLLNKIEAYRWGINNLTGHLKLEPAYIQKVLGELTYLRNVVCATTDPRMMNDAFAKFHKNIKSDLPSTVQKHWNDMAGKMLTYAISLRFDNDEEARTKLILTLPYPDHDRYLLVLPAKAPGKPDDYIFGAFEDKDNNKLIGDNYYGLALKALVKRY